MDQRSIMARVVALSRQGLEGGFGYPFGCVIVKDGAVVGEAHNEVLATNDPTAHAELLAIRRAAAKLKTYDLQGCELYTNGTPCCMCMSSMLWAHIDRAYYICEEKDSEAIGMGDRDFYDEVARPLAARKIIPMVHLPELRDDAFAVYRLWKERQDKAG
jgi:tRNA(Arg) A34 adenosine deaminase TadA